MAGNLIGEPFEDYVNKQIKRRQKIQGESNRSLDEIQYLSNRNAWIKLASGVSIEEERLNLLKKNGNSLITDASITTGQDLAISYILFNGLTSFGSSFQRDETVEQEDYFESSKQGKKVTFQTKTGNKIEFPSFN